MHPILEQQPRELVGMNSLAVASGTHYIYNARLDPYKHLRHYIYDPGYRVVSVLFPGWTVPGAYPRAAGVRPRLQILLAEYRSVVE
jgi:hypothetical protein